MAEDLKITFEMEMNRVEEYMPTRLLRMMWKHAMDLLNQLQAYVDELEELNSRDCHTVSTSMSEA